MRARIAGLLAAAAAVAAFLGIYSAHDGPVPVARAAAKPCGSGFTHAVIDGEHKCLRPGQSCQRDADARYHAYGFHCHRANDFRLTRRVQRIQARITAVRDGNTLRVRAYGAKRKRYRVQLIGISTPAYPGECGGAHAKDAMIRLSFNAAGDSDGDGLLDKGVGRGRRVELVTDPSQELFDFFGRLTAYVTRSGTDFGARQVRAGWAEVYVPTRRFRRYARYQEAEDRARAAGRGVWGLCDGDFHRPESPYTLPTPPPAPPVPPAPTPTPSPAPACNPNYSGACLPLTGDVDCSEITARNFYVVGTDVFRLDADGDRIACET